MEMIDVKELSTNLVKEAVESTVSKQVKEGRPAGIRNLTFDGSVGSNADQLFLKYGRTLNKKETELEQLGNRIAALSAMMSDDEIDQAVADPNSELFKLVQQYNEVEKYADSLESIMTKYAQEYKNNDKVVSDTTRAELRNFDRDELNRYNTDLYQKSLNNLKAALSKRGLNRDSFDNMGVDANDPKVQKWTTEQSR
jgi:hypothetical protein